jgi:hypothetical protein
MGERSIEDAPRDRVVMLYGTVEGENLPKGPIWTVGRWDDARNCWVVGNGGPGSVEIRAISWAEVGDDIGGPRVRH